MIKSLMLSSSSSSTSSPVPRFTDDPLATLGIQQKDTLKTNHSKFSFLTNRLPAKSRKVDDIYAVSRNNPLFDLDRDFSEIMASTSSGDKPATDQRSFSSRSEQNPSPTTSSGYESAVVVEQRLQTVVKELGPANDYRRQFALGPSVSSSSLNSTSSTKSQRLGRANVLHQNSHYVTRIQMPSGPVPPAIPNRIRSYESSELVSQNTPKSVPQPVWPYGSKSNDKEDTAGSAVIQQNENFVTKILIASPSTSTNDGDDVDNQGYDSIVTDSLLLWMSYSQETSNKLENSAVVGVSATDLGESMNASGVDRSEAELAVIRQLSQTISQSQTMTTVSRALSKANSVSSSGGGSDFYASRLAPVPGSGRQQLSASRATAAPLSGSLAKRIAMIKERWEQSARRRLLSENDDDSRYQRLVPKNGDLNFILQTPPPVGSSSSGSDSNRRQHYPHQSQLQSPIIEDRQHHIPYLLPSSGQFDSDRLSNSSSRSSGSRRVTFSADTVDNENSSPSSTSSRSQELKLGPQYLSIGYHLYANKDNWQQGGEGGGVGGGFYPYNLQMHSQPLQPSNKGPIIDSKRKADQAFTCSLASLASSPPSAAGSSTIIRMAGPYGHLQLHPNYGAACQDITPCVDFTLDSGDVSLLQRRSVSDKLRRRLCCCFLLLLCFAVLVLVVIGLSLYLTHGQRYFGGL